MSGKEERIAQRKRDDEVKELARKLRYEWRSGAVAR